MAVAPPSSLCSWLATRLLELRRPLALLPGALQPGQDLGFHHALEFCQTRQSSGPPQPEQAVGFPRASGFRQPGHPLGFPQSGQTSETPQPGLGPVQPGQLLGFVHLAQAQESAQPGQAQGFHQTGQAAAFHQPILGQRFQQPVPVRWLQQRANQPAAISALGVQRSAATFASAAVGGDGAGAAAGAGQAEEARPRRCRKPNNFFDMVRVLPEWGVGARVFRRNWHVVKDFKVTRVKLSDSTGRHGKAWGILYYKGVPLGKETQIRGVCKRGWGYVTEERPGSVRHAWKELARIEDAAENS